MAIKKLTNKLNYETCAANVGGRFDMIIIACARARELRRGYAKKVNTDNGNVVTALQEIEEGLVGREYLNKVK
jgi:DNA-directed RNA polymerase omega subunit